MTNINGNFPSTQSIHTPYLSHTQKSVESHIMRQIPHTPHILKLYNDCKMDIIDSQLQPKLST